MGGLHGIGIVPIDKILHMYIPGTSTAKGIEPGKIL